MLVRKPYVAGQFYPGTKNELRATLRSLIEKGGKENNATKRAKGLILPHAGYMYSGEVAADAVRRFEPADIYIIMGPNHSGLGKPFSVMAQGQWKTPLGDVDIESELARQLLKESPYLEDDTAAHDFEHSVEVILPFLQFLKKDFRFVPIIVAQAPFDALKAIAGGIISAVEKLAVRDRVCVIASSDMTHYESRDSASQKDHYAIEAILALDAKDLLNRVETRKISMCGVAPACIMLETVKGLGAQKAELIRYRTSGDVTGDFRSVVGYAGVSIT